MNFANKKDNRTQKNAITIIGNDHTIEPAANFKQVTGSYLERRIPNRDAPAICK